MTTRGFFTFAQGPEYLRQAYALALSIKASQAGPNGLSIGVDSIGDVPEQYRSTFDHIIEIPWGDDAKDDSWKRKNEWKAVHMSPYDETIKLDADMLFTTDISGWWDLLKAEDFIIASTPRTYRDELVSSDYYRKAFTDNKLPNVYTAMYYFKKKDEVFELMSMANFIFNNWQTVYEQMLLPNSRPKHVSADVVFALAIKLMGMDCLGANIPTFVHMKSQLQNWEDAYSSEDWTTLMPSRLTDAGHLKIGGHHQLLPVHYVVKDFVTDAMITQLEELVHG